jgi:hypothetical protein
MTASTTTGSSVAEIVDAFNTAWNDHDLGAALALTSTDCVFESTPPAIGWSSNGGTTGATATSAASTSSPYRAAWSPRSSPTSRADRPLT